MKSSHYYFGATAAVLRSLWTNNNRGNSIYSPGDEAVKVCSACNSLHPMCDDVILSLMLPYVKCTSIHHRINSSWTLNINKWTGYLWFSDALIKTKPWNWFIPLTDERLFSSWNSMAGV